jgi:hypothetical protein
LPEVISFFLKLFLIFQHAGPAPGGSAWKLYPKNNESHIAGGHGVSPNWLVAAIRTNRSYRNYQEFFGAIPAVSPTVERETAIAQDGVTIP